MSERKILTEAQIRRKISSELTGISKHIQKASDHLSHADNAREKLHYFVEENWPYYEQERRKRKGK